MGKSDVAESQCRAAPGKAKTPGVLSICRAFSIYHKYFDPDVILSEVQGNWMFMDRRDGGVAWPLMRDGVFDPLETRVFKDQLRPGLNVVDIGANIGYFSLIAAREVGDSGRVFSFEPQPRNFGLLKKNIRVNGFKNVEAFNWAITNKKGKTRLYVDGFNQGAHSLSENNLIKKDTYIEAKTETVDQFVSERGLKIDLFKIDTQGAEGLITEGARKTFSQNGITIIMEFWPWGLNNIGTDPLELLREIKELGFRVKVMDEKTQSFPDLSFEEIVNKSYERDNGWGFFNLLLTK